MFKMAFVCSGNLCRSPLAAATVVSRTADLAVEIKSFGLLDIAGTLPPKEMLEAARSVGIGLERHRSMPLPPGGLGEMDLVVGFEWPHLAAAVVEGGANQAVAFTLPEIVTLLEGLGGVRTEDPEEARRRIQTANELRRSRSGLPPRIDDPMGAAKHKYGEVAGEVSGLSIRLVRGLFGHPSESTGMSPLTEEFSSAERGPDGSFQGHPSPPELSDVMNEIESK